VQKPRGDIAMNTAESESHKRVETPIRFRFWRHALGGILIPAMALLMNCAWAQDTTVAVWDFDNYEVATAGSSSQTNLSRVLAEMLTEYLLAQPGIRVVERSRLREILDEQKLGSSALADEDTRLRLGRLAGARHMIFGSLMNIAGMSRTDIRLVSVETTQIIASRESTAQASDLGAAMQDVARAFARQLGHGVVNGGNMSTKSANPATLQMFDTGLALMDQKNFDAALEVFKKIISTDPGFTPAERQLKIVLDRLTRQ
jgi:hypothetical protein